MSGDADHAGPQTLAELREQARLLAADLPGPLRRVQVRQGDAAIEVEWQPAAAPAPAPAHEPVPVPVQVPAPADAARQLVPAGAAGAHTNGDRPAAAGESVVASPMVGTFYRSPSPGEPPYVTVGDVVEAGQTVAIVEAMKLFNPITAESAGTVVAVLAEDGQPVEFDQPLIRLAETP